MSFESQKIEALKRNDYSNKGEIDSSLRPLVSMINKSPYYYTTSSCSGRVSLCTSSKDKGTGFRFFKVSHNTIRACVWAKAAKKITAQSYDLKMEPMIMHVCCDSHKHASELLHAGISSGLKNSGAKCLSKRIVVELTSSLTLEMPLKISGINIVTKEGLMLALERANYKMLKNNEIIRKLQKKIKGLLLYHGSHKDYYQNHSQNHTNH